jgi:Asp/Glu/hydantoin racemase
MPTIALIHTSASMIPLFKGLADELLPRHVTLFNVVDESLLCDIIREGGCPPLTARRLVGHVLSAEQAGADHILVTCSSMGPAVDAAQALVSATVCRVDTPMADAAIAAGRRIGVIATLPSTLKPTADLIARRAHAAGRSVQLETRLVDGAFAAVISGDGPRHDALVAAGLRALLPRVDVIVLAQASMARVVESLPAADRSIPILSSPRLAMQHLAQLLSADPAPARNGSTQSSNAPVAANG